MMIGTAFGIFYPTIRKPSTVEPGDLRDVQVRARRAYDLDMLRKQYLPELGPNVALRNSDYQLRAYCTRAQLARALTMITLDMDYEKFKHTPVDRHGDKRLLRVYEGIWSVHLREFSDGSVYGRNTKSRTRALTQRDWHDDDIPVATETITYTPMSSLTQRQRDLLWETSESDRRGSEGTNVDFDELDELDDQIPPVVNGRMDHNQCSHAKTKSARRRCRKYWMR